MNDAGIIDLVPARLRQEWGRRGWYPNRSVFQMFRQHAERHPGKAAVLASDGTAIRYGELLDKALRLAASLKARGIVAGDVVAYQLPNTWHCCAIDLAAAALGAVVAPFPPGRGRLDLESLLKRCGARAVVVAPADGEIDPCDLIESLRPTVLSLRLLIVDGDGDARAGWHAFDALLQAEPIAPDALPHVCPDSPVRFLISSGTESEPKLVAYSHNALMGGRGRFLQYLHPEGETFRGLFLVPLGSAFGASATFGALCWLGGSIALLPKFDTAQAIAAIGALRPTHVLGVPTMLQRMAADPALDEIDRSSLVALVSGGSMIDEASVARCKRAFGCGFISLYGSADGVNCHNALGDAVIFNRVGRPNPSICELQIVDETGQRIPSGEVGEIVARGPMSPMQYVNAPDLDARYRDSGGWVRTGDLGSIDGDGYLVLAGRKKDIIIRGGANISTVQIENLATAHPDVVSAACVPVPDLDLGQRVCLCLTVRDGAERPSLSDINAFLRRSGLEVNKLPEYLRYVRRFPLTPAGKVDKKELAAEVAFVARGGAAVC